MRELFSSKPELTFNIRADLHIVKDYHAKYNKIDRILDENPEILHAVHDDLFQKMGSLKGRNSHYSTEMLFRMLLVKCIEGLSFRDLVIHVNDSMFLRNFVRIGWGKLMNFTLLDAAWKCIDDTTWDTVNGHLFDYGKNNGMIKGDDLRIDSTVCETNIHYPTDSFLLWDSYRTVSRMIQQIGTADIKFKMDFRFHNQKIKQLHTFISTQISRKQKSTVRNVKRAMKILIERVEDITRKGELLLDLVRSIEKDNLLADKLGLLLQNVHHVTDQARRCNINGETVPATERIFSIFEEHTELHKRGKAGKPVEFGHLVTIAQTKNKFISFYRVEEISKHDTEIKDMALENHKAQFDSYPKKFTADKNYHISTEDTEEWKQKIPTYSVGKKGKRDESEIGWEHSEEFRLMQRFRAGCEGSISVLKRVFGLKRCLYRGFKSFASAICRLVFCHNLVKLATG
jgi:IS5 family transposase